MKTIVAMFDCPTLRDIRLGRAIEVVKTTVPKEIPFRVMCCETQSGGRILAEFVCRGAERVQFPPESKIRDFLHQHHLSSDLWRDCLEGELAWVWHVSDVIDYCNTKGQRVRNVTELGFKRPPVNWAYCKKMNEIAELAESMMASASKRQEKEAEPCRNT